MARPLSSVARLTASLAENVTVVTLSRRGYGAASAAATAEKMKAAAAAAGGGKAVTVASSSSSISPPPSSHINSWVPDPVTGYYRPGNQRVQMDAAELRQMFLSKN